MVIYKHLNISLGEQYFLVSYFFWATFLVFSFLISLSIQMVLQKDLITHLYDQSFVNSFLGI